MAPQPFRPMPLVRLGRRLRPSRLAVRGEARRVRALAHIDGPRCELRSGNGHTFKHWPQLRNDIARALKAHDAVLDGEIVCLDRRGRSHFKTLLHRRDWPFFYAFDLLAVDGEDLRDWPLINRKRRLRSIIPPRSSRPLYAEHVVGRRRDFFSVACEHDLEGIVGKFAQGRYLLEHSRTNWIKIKNRRYTQLDGRHELFERRTARQPTGKQRVELALP
jgi:bifunctional non-homologous end joining protein LigD